jgi:C-terminal processing protease CtpA/Prc
VKNKEIHRSVPAVSFLTVGFLVSIISLSNSGLAFAQADAAYDAGFAEAQSFADEANTKKSESGKASTEENRESYAVPVSAADENDSTYDEIWSLVDAHFLYRDRLKNWNLWRHKFDHQMKTREQAQAAINTMIDSLADEYTFFRDESATDERKSLRQKTKVVDYEMLEGQIGYVHITTFNSMFCVPETRNALIELSQAHGLIIDLRDNWGGSINTTFDVFSLLTSSGKFVSMKGTTDNADYSEEMTLSDDSAITVTDGVETRSLREFNLTGGKPLVVLVNETTKSAAEMLAGAIRDNGRGTVLGSRTYGKGIVQRVWEFPNNTSIKISSARYFLPSGAYVHRVGLNPDVYVANDVLQKTKQGGWSTKNKAKLYADTKLLNPNPDEKKTYSMVMQLQIDRLAHHQSISPAGELTGKTNDRQLNEAQMVLRRKLVSLAKP